MQNSDSELILTTARNEFISELETKNFFWRINRLDTFVDLIQSLGFEFILKPNLKTKTELLNNCVKALIVDSSHTIDVQLCTASEIAEIIASEVPRIIEQYDNFIQTFLDVDNVVSIIDELNYLKVYKDVVGSGFPKKSIGNILISLL